MNANKDQEVCIFTIVSKNYLHFARTLMASVHKHAPQAKLVVAICDRLEGLDLSKEIFDVILIEDLPLPDIEEFIFQYNILELNTAIKPFVFDKLFNLGWDKVIYFDPDIRIYDNLSGMIALLNEHEILLTPHLIDLLDDGKHPNELSLLQAGTYNLGYLGLRQSSEANRLLQWWQSKMKRDCIVDIPRGLFVDQKWMDMVPGLFDGVYINRDPGWNVAYWNLNHREVKKTKNGYQVNKRPLVFFHYSGFNADGTVFSKHQDRFTFRNIGKAVRKMANDYATELKANGSEIMGKLPYAFATFPDGTPIPDVVRQTFREYRPSFGSARNLFSNKEMKKLLEFLNAPAEVNGRSAPHVTRLSYKLYSLRSDLKAAFPDVFGADSNPYASWFIQHASEQHGLPALFIQPVRDAVAIHNANISGEAPPQEKNMRRIAKSLHQQFFRVAYKFIVKHKLSAPRFLQPKTRQKIRDWMLQHAFVPSTPSTAPDHQHTLSQQSRGLNVIGYLHAESGVGAAARSSLCAADAAGLEISGVDFRIGNVSRMEEKIPGKLLGEQKHHINLFHINADQMPVVYEELGASFFQGHYNIGYWFWELGDFPDRYLDSFDYLDEVWVASTFCQNAISRKASVPVVHIPLCIEPHIPKDIGRKELSLPEKGFLILSMMDFLSVPERKNPLAILESYKRAFGSNTKDVYLVLKVINSQHCSKTQKKIMKYVDDDPSIILIDRYFSRLELNALMNNVDCYFSMQRSEGFGLPIAEAMYMGKPVITTGWSSNMDFMNTNNSLPVNYSLIDLEEDAGPYEKGAIWADPDIDHAAECLQRIVVDKDLVKRLGNRAAQDMRENYSSIAVGELIRKRIELIHRRIMG